MSVKAQSLVWESDLDPHLRLVLLAYADHANDDGASIYPGEARMATKTGYSPGQVRRHTKDLVDLGLLIRVKRGYRGQRAEYRIDLAAVGARRRAAIGKARVDAEKGARTRGERRAYTLPQTISEPSEEPSSEEVGVRRQDLLWERFVEIHGEPASKGERGKYNRAVSLLREADVDPDEYPALVAAYASKHDGLQPAVMTVATRVGEMRHYARHGPISARTFERQQSIARMEAAAEEDERESIGMGTGETGG